MTKRTAHYTRTVVEGLSNFSPYRGSKLTYVKEYDPSPNINVDLTVKMDIERAIKILYQRKELTTQEVKFLHYVMMDGRLSRRNISEMIHSDEGIYIDQRTISRKLESAYLKISEFLGWEYSDRRLFQIIAKKLGRPDGVGLSTQEEIEITQKWERM